ncbi:MAG: glutamate-cysteine ligase family protein [Promethearchaeati archaeon SRVP18_Atabeyarchaeia-1]
MPIVDTIMKDLYGRVVNAVEYPRYVVGKELQSHVLELKSKKPFYSPVDFENAMHQGVLFVSDFIKSKYGASLLGTGMHPLIRINEAKIWSHRHRSIYRAYEKIFNVRQHGWLNIQAFQLNLPYGGTKKGPTFHNLLASIVPYIPAITAASPIYEGKFGDYVDNRLHFYKKNQIEIPTLVGDVIPEYVNSTDEYVETVIGRYSRDLARANASKCIINVEWINSRGIVFRFDRHAIEIRVIDEQDCIKSDVAVSCLIRAAMRGLLRDDDKLQLPPHEMLVKDFNSVMRHGLDAKVQHPKGSTSRDVCRYLFQLASNNALDEEKAYLPIVRRRIEECNLSQAIARNVERGSQKVGMHEAILKTYLDLVKSLRENKPYF